VNAPMYQQHPDMKWPDAIVEISDHVRIHVPFLARARKMVMAARAANGAPRVSEDSIGFLAYEQVSGENKGALMLVHDFGESFSSGLFVMVPPGWWWFAETLSSEEYDAMMDHASSRVTKAA